MVSIALQGQQKGKILLVEDEDSIREFIVITLQRSGYEVVACGDAESASEAHRRDGDFIAAVLDIMLPGRSGLELCRELRDRDSTLGIILLTAKTQEEDKLGGFSSGADDYVTKPFSPSELLARLDAMKNKMEALRGVPPKSRVIQSGPFALDQSLRVFRKNDERIPLTQVEYALIRLFLQNRGLVLSREEILSKVWADVPGTEEKAVDVNIRRLRVKIEDNAADPKVIVTVWGIGYRWNLP